MPLKVSSPSQSRPSGVDLGGRQGGTPMASLGKLRPITLPVQFKHNPVVLAEQEQRASDIQLRIADWITGFAGSMNFVYLHVVLFTVWMLFIESKPWPTLTLIVSLEAIFLSTFVMIGQNRQSSLQQEKADHDFVAQEQELKTNTDLTRQVHQMTQEIHAVVTAQPTQRS